jgi:TatD DNase family protein
MIPFIDLHCHLDLCSDTEGAISRAEAAGVRMVTSGIHPPSNRQALEYASAHNSVKASLGLYPIDALHRESGDFVIDVDGEIEFIRQNSDRIMAIGEIGLDYKTGQNKVEQKELFIRFLELARELEKPVIIHSRDAESDALDILSEYDDLKVVLHCFSGKKELVKRADSLGISFTIPTNIVRSDHFKDLVSIVPINRLFCETDSPFLSPYPGKRNEPAYVIESYKEIARIKGLELSETANLIFNNYQRVFE